MSQELIEQENVEDENKPSISSTIISGSRASRNIQTALSILPTAGQHRYTDGEKTNIPIQTSLTFLPDESNTEILPLFSLKPEERTIVLWKKQSQGDGLHKPEHELDSFNYQQLLDECSNEREKEMILAISSAIHMLSKQLLNLKVVYERFLETNLKEIEGNPPKEFEEGNTDEGKPIEDIEENNEENARKISFKITDKTLSKIADITLSCFDLEKLTADADEFPMDRTYDPIEKIYVPARNIVTFRETIPMPRITSMVAMFETELGNYTPYDFNPPPKKEKPPARGMFDTDIGRPVPFCPLCICEHEIQSKCPGGCNYFEIWGNLPLNNPPDQLPQIESFCPPRAMFDYDLIGKTHPLLPLLRDRIVRPGGAMLDVDLTEIELPILCTCERVEDPELECSCDIEKFLLSSWSTQELICDSCQDDNQNQNVRAMFDTDLFREHIEDELSRERSVSTNEEKHDEDEDEEEKGTPETETDIEAIEDEEEAEKELETPEDIEISISEELEFSVNVELITDSDITPMWDTDLGQSAVPFEDKDDVDSIDSVKNDRPMFDFDLLGSLRPETPIEFRRVKPGGAMFDVDIGTVPDTNDHCFCVLHMLPDCICGCAFEHLFEEFGIVAQDDEEENPCTEDIFHINRPMYDYDLFGGKRPSVDPKSRNVVSGAAMFDYDLLCEEEIQFNEEEFNQDMRNLDIENDEGIAMFDYNLQGGVTPIFEGTEFERTEVPSGGAMYDNDLTKATESEKEVSIKPYKEDEGRPMFDYDLSSCQDIVKMEDKIMVEEDKINPMFDIDLDFKINDEEDVEVEYKENESDTDEVMHDYNLTGWITTNGSQWVKPKTPPNEKIESSYAMFDTNIGEDVIVTSLCKCDEEWSAECPCGCKYYEFYMEIEAKKGPKKLRKVTSNISNFDERAMFDYDLRGGQRLEVEKPRNISAAPYDPDQEYIGLEKVCDICMYDTDLGHLVSPQDRAAYLEYFGDEAEKFPDGDDDGIKLQEVYSDDRAMFDYHLYGGVKPIKVPMEVTVPRRVVEGAAMFDTDLEYTEIKEDENQEVVDVEINPQISIRGMFDYDLQEAIVKLGSMDISVDERIDCERKQCESPIQSEENLFEEPKDDSQDDSKDKPPEPPESDENNPCSSNKITKIKPVEDTKCQVEVNSETIEKGEMIKDIMPPQRNDTQLIDSSDPCQCRKGDKQNSKLTNGDFKCLCKNAYLDRQPKPNQVSKLSPSPCPASQREKTLNKYENQDCFQIGTSIPASSYKFGPVRDPNQNKYEIPSKSSKISYASTGISQQGANAPRVAGIQGFQNFDDITLKYTEKSRRQKGVVRQITGSVSGSKQGSFTSTASAHTHHTVETHSSVLIRLQPSRSMTRPRRYPQSSTSIKETPSVYQSDVSHRYAPFLTGPLLAQLPQAPSRQAPQNNVTVVLAEHRPHRVGHRHGHRHSRKTAENSQQVQLSKTKRPAISPVTSSFKTGREPSKETPTFILGSTSVKSDPNDFPFLK